MASCMKNIAQGLGVKLNEVFLIDDDKYKICDYFRITENDLEYDFRWQSSSRSWRTAKNRVLVLLVKGKVKITKLPWVPKNGNKYYTPFISEYRSFISYIWNGDGIDKANLKKELFVRLQKRTLKWLKKYWQR